MRLSALLVVAGLTLGAGGCATVEAPPAPIASGAPKPVEGYDWRFSGDDASARLAFGGEESDDFRLGLDCARRSGRLALSVLAPKGAPPDIHLESGGETERFDAVSEPAGVAEGVFLTAETAADEPVFQRFRRVGWLALWQGETRETLTSHPASLDGIERFFAFCG